MNYVKIDPYSISNGPGVRVAVFVAGCHKRCPGCHNPEAWDFQAGRPFDAMDSIMKHLSRPHKEGITILGGEPLAPENADTVAVICRLAKIVRPDKSVWLYTGYTVNPNDIDDGEADPWVMAKIVPYVDVIVDGPYEEDKRIPDGEDFRGSYNQRYWVKQKDGTWNHAVTW